MSDPTPIFGQLAGEWLWVEERRGDVGEHYDSDGRVDRTPTPPDPDDLDWSPAYSTWTPCEDRTHPRDPVDEDT